jgi:hypothetical protein
MQTGRKARLVVAFEVEERALCLAHFTSLFKKENSYAL